MKYTEVAVYEGDEPGGFPFSGTELERLNSTPSSSKKGAVLMEYTPGEEDKRA